MLYIIQYDKLTYILKNTAFYHHYFANLTDLFRNYFTLFTVSQDDTLPIQSGSGLCTSHQEGSGILDHFSIDKIADVVKQKLLPTVTAELTKLIPAAATAANTAWQNFNLNQPAELEVVPENTTPPLPFNNTVSKCDLNDVFDESRLLKLLPPSHRRKAEVLIRQFNKHPNELTWSSDGTILVDEVSIPNSDIYLLLPLLFKSSRQSKAPGFEDFVLKIKEMGLDHLINSKHVKSIKSIASSPKTNKSKNWWFIG